MAKADIEDTLKVPFDKLFDAIVRYEDYPAFVEGCTSVKVERKGAGKARVTYHVSMMKDVTYTLDHTEDREKGVIEWKLVDSDAFKANSGRWELVRSGESATKIRYGLEIEFKFPVPGFILNKLVKGSLPSMVKSFEKQALKSKG